MIQIKKLEFENILGYETWLEQNKKFIKVVNIQLPRNNIVSYPVSYRLRGRQSPIKVTYYEFPQD
jgi:hypothetical protein